ncbi:P-loop containing nucleoside triphosphate hydrolase protein, partial [Mycena olivaceomarginata]
ISETPLGDVLHDKHVLELMLRRAQLAVLDPGTDLATIMRMDVKEIKERSSNPSIAAFSKNLVCVDLEGPDLTDFQFVDLPGLIQNAASDIVRLVEEMVVDHISGNCLILVAIPMTDDIENQKALSLARQQDPNGARTIGVLTKPDLLSRGSASRQLWLDVVGSCYYIWAVGTLHQRQKIPHPKSKSRPNAETITFARNGDGETFKRVHGSGCIKVRKRVQ